MIAHLSTADHAGRCHRAHAPHHTINPWLTLTAGQEYRPITDQELKRTSVYAIVIESWSGKRNWPGEAEQSEEWPRLNPVTD
jgi:hypothetical protein